MGAQVDTPQGKLAAWEGDPTRWGLWDSTTGDYLTGDTIFDDTNLPLIARLEHLGISVPGLNQWCEQTEQDAAQALGSASVDELAGIDVEAENGPGTLRALLRAQQFYMHMDTPDVTLAVLAAAVSSAITDGEPLWLMEVGPSSSGKGETLRIIDGAVHKRVKDVTLAGLLSTRKAGDRHVNCGLLSSIDGENSVISITDFSAMLSPDKSSGNAKMEIFNALRDIYDGEYSRTLHQHVAEWKGRVSLIAACTKAIDQFSAHSDSLGTRWVYYRLPERDNDTLRSIAQMVARRGSLKQDRARTMDIAAGIIEEARAVAPTVELDDDWESLIIDCALTASRARSSVPRERFGSQHEICDVPDIEEPGRLLNQLKLLARSLTALHVKREVAERIVRHAASSSMPAARSAVLRELHRVATPISTNALAQATSLDRKVVTRAAEDLEAVGIVISDDHAIEGVTASKGWHVAPNFVDELAVAFSRCD